MLNSPSTGAAVLAAALALPGMVPAANAESAPESGQIGFKYLSYRDSQPGLKRVSVDAPSENGNSRYTTPAISSAMVST